MADLEVAVTPRAGEDRVGPLRNGALLVRVTRPATDGEANRAVIRLVARALHVSAATVEIVAGVRARRKRLRLSSIDDDELARRLNAIGAD